MGATSVDFHGFQRLTDLAKGSVTCDNGLPRTLLYLRRDDFGSDGWEFESLRARTYRQFKAPVGGSGRGAVWRLVTSW